MREYELEVLEQYNLEIKGTRKMRGAFFCDTNEGAMLLRETNMSDRRALLFFDLLQNLAETDFPNVDIPIRNKEDALISTSRDGNRYILKRWFIGKECSVRERYDIQKGMQTLAVLHTHLNQASAQRTDMQADQEKSIPIGRHLRQEFLCHTKELKKIRSFIRKKGDKSKFEYLYLEHFDEMYEIAIKVMDMLEKSGYEELYQTSIAKQTIIHGDYNYHNILILPIQETAVTNFEHFRVDVQLQDFYYFLRKVMEKYNYEENIGNEMVDSYNKIKPLSKEEIYTIALKIAYPEKFWKIASGYYHSNKAWIPEKCVEKLEASIIEIPQKIRFLENIFSFHL